MKTEGYGISELDVFVESIAIGDGESYRNLTVFSLYSNYSVADNYTLLEEAVKSNKFTITEVSDQGRVPELKVFNQLDMDVLIIEGEELIGAKQNRVVNTSIIIGKGNEVIIPVSCVEEGRWNYRSRTFEPGEFHLYPELRAKKSISVTESLKESEVYYSDQSEVWEDISMKACKLSVDSETGDMQDIFVTFEKDLKDYEEAFNLHPDQIGFLAFINNRIVGCDIFGNKEILPKVYKKLLRGYFLDAIEEIEESENIALTEGKDYKQESQRFLNGLKQAKKSSFKSSGEGYDIRLESKGLNGFAIVDNKAVVHAAVFST